MDEPYDNPERRRYELEVDGQIAFADYRLHGKVMTLPHTLVPKALEGRGIAGRIIAFALADARAKGLKVIPQCPFVRVYIDRHPEWRDLLA